MTREYLETPRARRALCEFFWKPDGTARVSHIPYPKAHMHRASHPRAKGSLAAADPAMPRAGGPAAAVEMIDWVNGASRA